MMIRAATNKRDGKRALTAALLISALSLFLLTTSNTPEKKAISSLLQPAAAERVIANGKEMQLTEYAQDGKRFYALQVQDWTQYQRDQSHYVAFQTPNMELFDTNAPTSWRISAERGKIVQQDHKPDLELMDNVLLKQVPAASNTLRLRSDQLSVNATNNSITARGHVVLNSDPMQTTAAEMVMRNNKVLEFSGTLEQRVVSEIKLTDANSARSTTSTAPTDDA